MKKMKRILLFLWAVFAAVLLLFPVSSMAAVPEQDAEERYQIRNAEELLWFAQMVNSGNTEIHGILMEDIDLSGVTWPGIGSNENPFAGSLDGGGHTVTLDDSDKGLFSYTEGQEGECVRISNIITAGSVKSSALIHRAAYTYVTDCINRATVHSSEDQVAGIIGSVGGEYKAGYLYTDIKITNCGNEASIHGTDYVAGILGYATSGTRLYGCYNTGNIHGNENIGGLAGYMQESRGVCDVRSSYNLGRITGGDRVAGIIGTLYNGVTVSDCYNAGFASYAIAGYLYNNTASVQNCYFQGTRSARSVPDQVYVDQEEINSRAAARTAAEMSTAEFADALGDAFLPSCPSPVLSWQTAAEHSGSPCSSCGYGSTEKEEYEVSFQKQDGYTLSGEAKAVWGEDYVFSISLKEGYEENSRFAVKVNGTVVSSVGNGRYVAEDVRGPLSITVLGVQVIPGSYAVRLPGEGYGYRVTGAATVKRGEDYTFRVSFPEGFRAGESFSVTACEVVEDGAVAEELELTADHQGVYRIPAVTKAYRIDVSGVEAVSSGVTAVVDVTITEGYDDFHAAPNSEEIILDQRLTVPYFDLSLYGLEKYYYNPYCYQDESGNIRGIQQKGTPESAYGHITLMHAFIAATELYYLEYSPEQVGKGISYAEDPEGFREAISWSQDAGSSFMDFWEHGTNLNYYLNYEYPLAYKGWGATMDQILIKDGDVVSVHLITGTASGSRFGFFTVNDTDSRFTDSDRIDHYEAVQGERVSLTLYWTSTTGTYDTGYERMAGQKIYWIPQEETTEKVREWRRTNFGNTLADHLITDTNGTVVINTMGLDPGTYYIAALGGWTEGGGIDQGGFTSTGGEAGPSVFRLTVTERTYTTGDVNKDGRINATDAAMVYRFVRQTASFQTDQMLAADMNGDGRVNATDAAMIYRKVKQTLDAFSVK